jgi:hypothetical protein
MAKNQKTEVAVEKPQVVEQPKPKKVESVKPKWEIKNRLYYLKGRNKPLSYMLKSSDIYYFDEEKGYERELKYTKNQRTPFVDEMTGDQRLEHIIFRNGALFVEKEKTTLQKLLELHPFKDKIFYEHNAVEEAANEIEVLEMEADAILMARQIDVDLAEAIMRVEIGSKVSEMSSKELKRDLLVFARNNPALFLELAADDDQRNFLWSSNKRKIMTVPFDEHPYTALAHWFKTDEGMEIYANIEKRLNS